MKYLSDETGQLLLFGEVIAIIATILGAISIIFVGTALWIIVTSLGFYLLIVSFIILIYVKHLKKCHVKNCDRKES